MNTRAASDVDLAKLFNAVAVALKEKKAALNQADDFNHNHGDNMVKNFKVISKAVKEKQGLPPAEQLEYASRALSQKSKTGSAQLYAQGLAQAAEQVRGQPRITPDNALGLVQALLGGQPGEDGPQGASGDLSGLLGALLAGGGAPAAGAASVTGATGTAGTAASGQPEDLMGGLVGALLGGEGASQGAQSSSGQAPGGQTVGGINLNTLLNAGMAYMQTSQQGGTPMESLVQALLAGTQMSSTSSHAQSGQIVASTLIGMLGKMFGGNPHPRPLSQ